MRRTNLSAILSAAAGLVLFGFAGGSGAQLILASGSDADVTEDGLHRVDPSIMEAAWVKPELDLSRYTRILLMPTAVQFRDVSDQRYNARSRLNVTEFSLDDKEKEWLRAAWRSAVEARFAKDESYERFEGVDSDVLVVQAFLVDVVSRIPPNAVGSNFTLVKDPWSVTVVLELRDATTAELLARTIDRRNAQGLIEAGAVWMQTEDLVERWAQVPSDRLKQLSDLGGRGRMTPGWAR